MQQDLFLRNRELIAKFQAEVRTREETKNDVEK